MTSDKKTSPQPINGFVIIDKPAGLSSTQAMAKTRKLFQGKKAGHGGTLDPFATGVLLVALGEATKALPYILASDKEYEFTLRFGGETDSQDITGDIVATTDVIPTRAAIEAALPSFLGVTAQTPPMFSAIKIDGVASYTRARQARAARLAAENANATPTTAATMPANPAPTPAPLSRNIRIDEFALTAQLNERDFTFRARGQSGLYIRTLGHDLAKKLGSLGHVVALRRLAVGNFLLRDAFSLAKLSQMDYRERVNFALLDFCNRRLFSEDNSENNENNLDEHLENNVAKNIARLMGLKTIFLNAGDTIALRLGKKITTKKKEENKNLDLLLAIDENHQPIGFVSCTNGIITAKRIFVL
ncbi:MAG: tRNA pseudouridine(55) synthase TruB [Hydrotalea sp.]|nr:tRNA pseudouridine(55) synthase TruB [Hydrotalea sp.]